MSRITDSIYYTLLSDGCTVEEAAQTASVASNSLKAERYQSVPIIFGDRYEGRPSEVFLGQAARGSLGSHRYRPVYSA